MTFLDLINKVLRGLREDTVSGLSETYPQHIGQLVNEAKEEVEDLGPWYALRTILTGTLTASQSSLDLTSVTNDRSYLLFVKNRPQAWITEFNEERDLHVIEYGELLRIQTIDPDADEDIPAYVAFTRAGDGITAHFWPTPDEAYPYKFVFVVPQDELEDPNDELSVPARPVWQKALVLAMDERGEDFAGPVVRNEARAAQSLGDAVMRDFGTDEMTFEAV